MRKPSVQVTFTHTLADHVRAARLYYRATVFATLDRFVAIVALLLGIISVPAFGFRWWALLIVAVALLEWFHLLSPYALRAHIMFKQDPRFRDPCALTFSETGISLLAGGAASQLAWTRYSRVLEDAQLFVLVRGEWAYTIVPKRAFRDAAQQEAVRALLAAKIGPHKAKSAPSPRS